MKRFLISAFLVLVLVSSALADGLIIASSTGGGYATPAAVGSPVSAYTSAVTKSVTSGNMLLVGVSGSPGTCSVATTSGTTSSWTEAGHYTGINSATQVEVYIFWATASSTGNVTVTASGTLGDVGMMFHEYSGIDTTSPQIGTLQTDTAADALDTNIATGNIDITGTGGAVLFAVGVSEVNDCTVTPGTGWTQRLNETNHIHKSFDRIVTTGTTYNFNATLGTGGETFAFAMAAFKAAAL